MAQQVPRTDKVRVKVYELRDNDWFDLGTGFCQPTFSRSEDGSENPRILVQAEEDPDKVLLNTKIQKENMFSKQQESLIVWLEPESGLDMALSFQEAEGSATIWDYVQNVLDSSTEDMTQNLPKPRAEVLGEVTEGPKTGTYGLVGEALAETLGGVGSKAQDVKAEIKMDVDNKSGDGKDALFLSFDTDGGLDAQSDFGPPHEAESVDKTEQPSQTEPPTLLSKEATQSITDLTLGYIKSYILGVRRRKV
ncbi:serine/threonine-protein phosphatase 4 regulatory subunit 3 [Trichoderma asperellum]|uniref:Serine/threonine-protein phosphatase 4 regulatory subunit 3 n=1 Tax=Trichoderma asperellum TaxID=101201 RepID=A0A6V8QWF7_TRIAP|nr:serine/threonine-protein phosphatase 4 regulatory subunit 3 [Trichoderma asperellum]